ncbi:hypothetical protein B0H66DRAFT_644390 [Apodospora peruviana]|uniref:Uncharacterized protein n=1 Tax=Apodospora peruviana TaxID=516989 RepID=A0AAE0HSV4_9PEZI|nr:hypothetical protein B0H66DRAFT_644390 [Apodospora peruviana]
MQATPLASSDLPAQERPDTNSGSAQHESNLEPLPLPPSPITGSSVSLVDAEVVSESAFEPHTQPTQTGSTLQVPPSSSFGSASVAEPKDVSKSAPHPTPPLVQTRLAAEALSSPISASSHHSDHELVAVSEPVSESSSTGTVDLTWRPFYLRRSVLSAFVILFVAILVVLETLPAVSNNNIGLGMVQADQKHTLWPYAPTAFFTLVAAFWGRVEYQSKLIAPWVWLSQGPVHASRTVLLDYLSDFQPYCVYKALRNKDFTVSITAIVSILTKLLVVFSTSLFRVSQTIHPQSYPMVAQDRFGESIRNSKQHQFNARFTYSVLRGFMDYNLPYPDGMSKDYYTYQSVVADVPNKTEIRVTVEALENSLKCLPVNVSLDGAFTGIFLDSRLGDLSTNTMNATFSSPVCGERTVSMEGPRWLCKENETKSPGTNSCTVTFAGMGWVECGGELNILVMFGNLTLMRSDEGIEAQSYVAELQSSTQILCVPSSKIFMVDVVRNGTETKSVTPSVNGSHITSRTNLSPQSSAQIMVACFDAHQNQTSLTDDIGVGYDDTTIATNLFMGSAMRMWSSRVMDNNMSTTWFYDVNNLQQAFTEYCLLCAMVVTKLLMMDPTPTDIDGVAVLNVNRLLVQGHTVQLLAGLTTACILLVVTALILVPEGGILPNDPTTLLGMAFLILHSHDLVAQLRFAGASGKKALHHLLRNSTYKTEIIRVPRSGQKLFVISLNQQDVDGGNAEESRDVGDTVTRDGRMLKSDLRHPLILRYNLRFLMAMILLGMIISLPMLSLVGEFRKGNPILLDDRDHTYSYYAWKAIPALVFGLLSMAFSSMDFETRSIAPYTAIRKSVRNKSFLTVNFLDLSIPRAIYTEFRFRNIGTLSMTVAFLIGSLFTTLSARLLWIEENYSSSQPEEVVRLRPRQMFNTKPDYLDGEAGLMASLILQSNLSFPSFADDTLVFPEYDLDPATLKDLDLATLEDLDISAWGAAWRPRMECRGYTSSNIQTRIMMGEAAADTPRRASSLQLSVKIEGERRRHWSTKPDNAQVTVWYSPLEEYAYFGKAGLTGGMEDMDGCSDLLYLWGAVKLPSTPTNPPDPNDLQNIASMGCNMTYEAVDTGAQVLGSRIHLYQNWPSDDLHTPDPVPVILQPYAPAFASSPNSTRSQRLGVYSKLESKGDANNLADKFFSILTTSRWAIPASYLGDSSANDIVADAIKHQHGILAAQVLRSQMFSVTAEFASNYSCQGHIVRYAFQVQQDTTSTRILQAMLGVSLVLLFVSWSFTDIKAERGSSMTAIAPVAALLAGGNMLEKLRPLDMDAAATGRSRRSPEDISKEAFPYGTRFRIGWTRETAPHVAAAAAISAAVAADNLGVEGASGDGNDGGGDNTVEQRFGIFAEERLDSIINSTNLVSYEYYA